MWCCTGRDASLVALAVALGACASDPDALITVERAGAARVDVQLCPASFVGCQPGRSLFTAEEPMTVTHSVGIYLDEPTDSLGVQFSVFASPTRCKRLLVPLGGGPRELRVALPDDAMPPTVTGCDDCQPGVCSP